MAHLRNPIVAVSFVLLLVITNIDAQSVARPDRGKGALVPTDSSGVENINLQNGNLSLTIPLANLPAPPGGKLGFTVNAHYNSKLWNTYLDQRVRQSPGDGMALYTVAMQSISMFGGWRIGGTYGVDFEDAELSDYLREHYLLGDEQLFTNYNWSKAFFNMPDGSRHEIRPLGYSPFWGQDDFYRGYYKDTPYTTGQPMRYYTSDGSYIWLTVYPDFYSPRWEAHLPDGTVIEQQAGIQRVMDRNGNKIKIFPDQNGVVHYQDEYTEREVTVAYNAGANKTEVKYQSTGGAWNTIEIIHGTTYVSGKFQNVDFPALPPQGGCMHEEGPFAELLQVIREIKLPATEQGIPGQKYQFAYNSDQVDPTTVYYHLGCWPTTTHTYNNPAKGWGELSEMTTPTGAVHKYGYYLDTTHVVGGNGANSEINAASNTIRSKQIVHDGQTDTWKYEVTEYNAKVTNPDGSTRYLEMYPHYPSMPSGMGGASGFGGLVYRETLSDRVRIERRWDRKVFTGAYEYSSGWTKLTFNPVITAEFTTLLDTNGTPELMSAKLYQYDFNGNQTSVSDYDWFDPGAVQRDTSNFPLAPPVGQQPLRTTTTEFFYSPGSAGSLDVYAKTTFPILNAAKQVTLGPSIQQIWYDNQGYDAPPTAGNITKRRSWDSATGQWISTSTAYDSRGNVTSQTDANGNVTEYTYGAIGGFTSLYPTQSVIAHGTGIARTSTMAYDFYTGLPTSTTDVDNSITVLTVYDIFGRPTLVRNAVGTALESSATTEYRDSARLVVARSDREALNDQKNVAIQHYDQLGRVRLSRTLEDPVNESPYDKQHGIKIETRYGLNDPTPTVVDDPQNTLGSYTLTSNPFRAASATGATNEQTMGWTLHYAHRSGRQSEVRTYSGAMMPAPWGANGNSTGVSSTTLVANATTTTDQAGKVRRSLTDALGQLRELHEPDSNNNLGSITSPYQKTVYAYDALGNLSAVTQNGTGVQCGPLGGTCSQTRNFSYSSVSRLLTASNPESGPISYTYDPNGNVKTKRDARNIKTVYDYDQLNRIKARCYRAIGTGPLGMTTCENNTENPEPNTPTVSYTYRMAAPGVGNLAKVESSVSATEFVAFDLLGRVTRSKQITGGVVYGDDTNPMTYTYNIAGGLVEQKYPSGRVVRNTLGVDGALDQM